MRSLSFSKLGSGRAMDGDSSNLDKPEHDP
jgi:hypothetical protein